MTRPFVALGSLALLALVCFVPAVCGQTTSNATKPSDPFNYNARVDATLGNLALQDRYAMSVSEGQQVQRIGVIRMLKGHPVFPARIVKLDGQVYTIRSEPGFPVSLWPAANSSSSPGVQP